LQQPDRIYQDLAKMLGTLHKALHSVRVAAGLPEHDASKRLEECKRALRKLPEPVQIQLLSKKARNFLWNLARRDLQKSLSTGEASNYM
jgi:hypothetical protein